MGLLTDIRAVITVMYPDATTIFSNKFNANLKSFSVEEADLPLIVIDNERDKDNEIKQNNNVQKDSKVLISILDLDATGNTDDQSETIRAEMEAIADRLAVQIYQLLPARPVGNQKYTNTPMFHVFNTNLTGVALEMRVNYNEVVSFKKELVT